MGILETQEYIFIVICSLSYFTDLFSATSFYDVNAWLNMRLVILHPIAWGGNKPLDFTTPAVECYKTCKDRHIHSKTLMDASLLEETDM